ncbi:MAG TPA: hypothetical protein VFS56_01170, partial [Gemmatimonadaceae bacterium]|nr:hypothetical protein [Gemmatimonadaceae bacterium]
MRRESNARRQQAGRSLKCLSLTAIIAVLLASRVDAQTTAVTTRGLSLEEAVRTAESQSEAVRIARAGVQRAQGQQYQA